MYGSMHNGGHEGLIYLSMDYLFGKIPQLHASCIEYYDGKFKDLLHGFSCLKKTKIHDIEALMAAVETPDDMHNIMKHSLGARITRATNQNTYSSRSHVITIFSSPTLTNHLLFVDLAGNECSDGKENVPETCMINKSLAQLNRVLLAHSRGQFIPYRENVFTQFLQPFFTKRKVVVFYHATNATFENDLFSIQDIVGAKKIK